MENNLNNGSAGNRPMLTGMFDPVVELFPSCPEEFSPQHFPVLSSRRAQVWASPAVIEITSDPKPETAARLVFATKVPSPN